ncbi:hypothetical protein ETN89_19650 (plasmid) [Photobacterium damselae subsp. damselae]|uniref:hypothetical protein n=1 Tax=Photobacterium damselae TaxID=38293 RepID=UPI000A2FD48A|nr:hypothetical protein [Photobacterium damselae]ARR51799.1 hypothetical protein CAY62_20500 [Photobacterium damselae subsp. damselae]QAY37484.1 hypothetical protein ETN89_19650 [Photobacterium damselae subsp. damselae]
MAQQTKIMTLDSIFCLGSKSEKPTKSEKPNIEFTPEFYSMVDFMRTQSPQDFKAKYQDWVNRSPEDFISTNITAHHEKVEMVKIAATLHSQ